MLADPTPLRDCPTSDRPLKHVSTRDDSAFERFLTIFPERDGGHDVDGAREAWARAIRRARPDVIVAGAEGYARASAGREKRFVMSARRWLNESRWRDAAPVSGAARPDLVWIKYGSREWEAWRRHYFETRSKSPPLDRRGGWRFPTRWPPDHDRQTL